MGKQLDLFGEPLPVGGSGRPRVGPAAVPERLQRLAQRLPREVRPGTSSWSFPGWQGLVYDRKAGAALLAREGLAAYAQHPLLRAVGIDRTFYAPISAAEFAAYADAVPEGFRFLVKAAGQCTMPNLRDGAARSTRSNELFLHCGFAAAEVVQPFVEGLGPKGAALLFQFPPLGRLVREPGRFAERLEAFLRGLPPGPSYHVELRDRELFGEEYLAALASAGAAHCLNLHPRMPPVAEQHARAGTPGRQPLVMRWMLHTSLGYEAARERYAPFSGIVDDDPASRRAVARICLEQIGQGRDVLVIANNKAEGSAPHTVFRLAESIVAELDAR